MSWAPSNKQVDLMCLALCSCCLTLLCHSITTLPQTATRQAVTQSTSTAPSLPLTDGFKAFTIPGTRPEIEDDEN